VSKARSRRPGARSRARLPLPRSLTLAVLAALVLLSALAPRWFGAWWDELFPAAPRGDPPPVTEGIHRVERVVDGDTVVLSCGTRVRLIGADTPETVKPNHPVEPFGPEATEFTRSWVEGSDVRIEFDGDRVDRYGRVLALVWVGDRMLNEELIRAGLAEARTQYNYSMALKGRFLAAQAEAQAARRGIWSLPKPAASPGNG
jgi:micrococcal nuclease